MSVIKKNLPAKFRFGQFSIVNILLWLGALLSMAWAVYFSLAIIFLPYQIELREGAALVLTKVLLNGGNPFTFENQPLAMNNYGLGYNLTVLPFAMLFGNTLVVHRAVTFIFILLAAGVICWSSYKTSGNFPLALVCGSFIIIGVDAGAFPSAMGTFLFLLVVLLPFQRQFDQTSLSAALVISVLAFYTKPYFILGYAIVLTYLFLFVSKKQAIIYGIFFTLLMAILFAVIRLVFPFYFIDTFIGNVSNTYRSSAHLLEQLIQLWLYFYPAILVAIVLLFADLFSKHAEPHTLRNLLNFSGWDQPLMNRPVNYLFYAFACALAAFLLILGPHIGSFMSYAYQLVVPLFLLWLFQKIRLTGKFGIIIALVLLFNLFLWEAQALSPNMIQPAEMGKWHKLLAYVKPSARILNSPVVTSNMVEAGLTPIESGQTIYFYNVKPYPDYAFLGPAYTDFQSVGMKYAERIDRTIKERHFDAIMTTDGEKSFYHEELINQYYFLDKKIIVVMPYSGEIWRILVWLPRVK